MHSVALLLPSEPGGNPWLEAAVTGAARSSTTGAPVRVLVGMSPELLPNESVVAHGIQWLPWVASARAAGDQRAIVLSDIPEQSALPPQVSVVDWGWDRAAYHLGRLAALRSKGAPVGFIAGPPVLTQQRVMANFALGSGSVEPGPPVYGVHLSTFSDPRATDIARVLVSTLSCQVVSHSCDKVGEEAALVARGLGAETCGFLVPVGDHLAVVRSDVTTMISRLIDMLVSETPLPAVITATLGGDMGLEVSDIIGGGLGGPA